MTQETNGVTETAAQADAWQTDPERVEREPTSPEPTNPDPTNPEPAGRPLLESTPPPIEARPSRRAEGSRAKDPDGISAAEAVARIRTVLATAVFTVAVLAALVLALGATLVALEANQGNVIVAGILDLAHQLEGPFADIFTFDSYVKQILINWGIAAVVFLVVGRVLERVLRP